MCITGGFDHNNLSVAIYRKNAGRQVKRVGTDDMAGNAHKIAGDVKEWNDATTNDSGATSNF